MNLPVSPSAEFFPEAAAAAGYVAGLAVEFYVQHKVERRREALADYSGIASDYEPSRRRRIAMAVLGPVAMSVAVAAGFNAVAWGADSGLKRDAPHIEVVVDHSGSTVTIDNPVVNQENSIAEKFNTKSLDTQFWIAKAGDANPATPKALTQDNPFGGAAVDSGVTKTLRSNEIVHNHTIGTYHPRSVGTLVITNGNSIGNASTVTEQAKAIGAPVYVVNVSSNNNRAPEFTKIAKDTGGKYWDSKSANPETIYKEVRDSLRSRVEAPPKHNRWPVRGLALASILGVPISYAWRKREAIASRSSTNRRSK